MRSRTGYKAKGQGRRCAEIRQVHEEQIKKEGIDNKIPTQLKRFLSTVK